MEWIGIISLLLIPIFGILIYELIQRFYMIKIYILTSSKEYFIVECPIGLSKIFKFYFWDCKKKGYPIVLREDIDVVDKVVRNRRKLLENEIPKNYKEISKRCKVKIL